MKLGFVFATLFTFATSSLTTKQDIEHYLRSSMRRKMHHRFRHRRPGSRPGSRPGAQQYVKLPTLLKQVKNAYKKEKLFRQMTQITNGYKSS